MIITVTQLNNYLKGVIEMDSVLSQIEVQGEVTNLRQSANYVYFSLKDESSQIDCFSYTNNPLQLSQGGVVTAYGNINYLTKSGRLSFYVKRAVATDIKGQAYLQFLALKEKLDKEGLFDLNRKKTVPSCCRKIGVVTSKTGAVIRDIESVVLRRQPFTDIFLYDVRVQGNTAVEEIVKGIAYFENFDVDVVIVARGGGSDEDLSVFNDEKVVRAVANCSKPTVSAIGHGVDFTLTDYVADRRAVTPTEAGEITTIDSQALKSTIVRLLNKNYNYIASKLQYITKSIQGGLYSINAVYQRKLSALQSRITKKLLQSKSSVQQKLVDRQWQIDTLTNKISYTNPMAQLRRGYAIVSSSGKRVTSIAQLKVNERSTIDFYDGQAQVIVDSVIVNGKSTENN